MNKNTKPKLSVVVVIHNMPMQASNTVASLCPSYQQSVSADDYEVIIIENRSLHLLDSRVISNFQGNIQYFLRDESGVSPAAAINEAFSKCRGDFVCLNIDGARLLSPKIIHYTLSAIKLSQNALVMTPAYHLGDTEQHHYNDLANIVEEQQNLLAKLQWKNNGYLLFEQSVPSPGNRTGFLNPFFECSTLTAAREHWLSIGPADLRFNLAGGGALNLHILRQLGLISDILPVVILGEGSFHQYHGGTTTSSSQERQSLLAQFKLQLDQIWLNEFHPLRKQPLYIGNLCEFSCPHFIQSCDFAHKRYKNCDASGKDYWADDTASPSIKISKIHSRHFENMSLFALHPELSQSSIDSLHSTFQYSNTESIGCIPIDLYLHPESNKGLQLPLDSSARTSISVLPNDRNTTLVATLINTINKINSGIIGITTIDLLSAPSDILKRILACLTAFPETLVVIPLTTDENPAARLSGSSNTLQSAQPTPIGALFIDASESGKAYLIRTLQNSPISIDEGRRSVTLLLGSALTPKSTTNISTPNFYLSDGLPKPLPVNSRNDLKFLQFFGFIEPDQTLQSSQIITHSYRASLYCEFGNNLTTH